MRIFTDEYALSVVRQLSSYSLSTPPYITSIKTKLRCREKMRKDNVMMTQMALCVCVWGGAVSLDAIACDTLAPGCLLRYTRCCDTLRPHPASRRFLLHDARRMSLRVECEHAGLVPSDEQKWWHVLGEHLEPRHVHGSRASALARHRQSHNY